MVEGRTSWTMTICCRVWQQRISRRTCRCCLCSGIVWSGWEIHVIPIREIVGVRAVLPGTKDPPRHSNESIGSGNGWNARIECDTHRSGHGLFERR
eukprot:scaffold378313_cov268-Cyclotella_meneghiniana.AAC.1